VGVLIDSSVLIGYERGQINLERHVGKASTEEFFISVVTASELLHGVHRAKDDAVRARRSAFVEAVLERFPILPVDTASARVHAQLWATLAAAGTPIGPHDMWLAAQTVANGFRFVTGNLREFARVPGLRVESWHV
jgi:tRNA(fMet)-specific endonuclease VapC